MTTHDISTRTTDDAKPRDDKVTLRFLASPQDTAANGIDVAPGRILEWIDRAGYACAVGWAKSYCVTAYVGNMHFTRPVRRGQLVELTAQIIHTGTTSMQILVSVRASTLDSSSTYRPTITCILVFVAIDEHRNPTPIPRWTPRQPAEIELHRSAQERLAARRVIRDRMLAESYTEHGTTPRSRLRFLAAPTHANWGGKTHGGTVMRWIDEAAYTVAASWSSDHAVASYSGGIHFLRPISIGNIVELDARLIHTSPDAMHIAIRVSSAPTREPRRLQLTTTCMSVFIDPDHRDRPRPVTALDLLSDEDIRLDQHARDLIEMRATLPVIGHVL